LSFEALLAQKPGGNKMRVIRLTGQLTLLLVLLNVMAVAQTGDTKNFAKDGLLFDYPAGWTLQDDSNGDLQQFTLSRADADAQIRIIVHRGKIKPEKLPDARKAIIDPYIASIGNQFVSMGATPKQASDSAEIGGVKAEGTKMTASIGGEPGAARIYWVLLDQRVTLLTYLGPDRDLIKFVAAWDLVRTSIKINNPQPDPKSSPKP